MRRGVCLLVFLVLVPTASAASPVRGFTFGREGGNIMPYSVTVTSAGVVSTTGNAVVGRKHLTVAQLRAVDAAMTAQRFATLPHSTLCTGTNPDVAATYVTYAGRKVRVHGGCVARYARVWAAVTAAVRLKN